MGLQGGIGEQQGEDVLEMGDEGLGQAMGWIPVESLPGGICWIAEPRQPTRPKACIWCAALGGARQYWKDVKTNAKNVCIALHGTHRGGLPGDHQLRA